MSAIVVERLRLHRLEVPLASPYKLSFGPVTKFDTILVEAQDSDGRIGLGEATLLTGYTDETVAGAWDLMQRVAAGFPGLPPQRCIEETISLAQGAPFAASGLATAMEMLLASPWLRVDEATRVPLLGLVNGDDPGELEVEVTKLLAEGFGTLKIKVGFDAARDARRVKRIQKAVAGRCRLRIDANQGYDREQGRAFAAALDPEGIELFEQPCAAGDWDSHLAVARVAQVPMMLDESIYGIDDIDRAAELSAARYIKVKLMKLGTLERLAAAIARIKALGMRAVLGNGVACDLGCWMEACVAARTIDNAGEMNGFLKARSGLLTTPLEFEDGAIVLRTGFAPRLDHERIAPYRLDFAGFVRTGPVIAVRETSQ